MSKPKTIREWLDRLNHDLVREAARLRLDAKTVAVERATMRTVKHSADTHDILDAHIPGANAVVAPQGLEDAAKAYYERVNAKFGGGVDWEDDFDLSAKLQEQKKWLVETMRLALEAAKIEVVDESLQTQVDRLANFIMAEIDGEPSRNEGAVDTAIRLLRRTVTVSHSKEE